MIEEPTRARLTPKTDASGNRRDGSPVDVHFNPESLALTIRNTMEEAKEDTTAGRPSQLVASSEVTLAVQLVFDTTTTGVDVRTTTADIAEMMRPGAVVPREDGKKRPMVVEFSWNEFAFEGIISDYSETLDYFSTEGIPLRSNLNITFTKHEAAFPAAGGGASDVGAGSAPPTAPVASGDTVSDSVNRSGSGGGAPGGSETTAANEVAAANGVENLKDPGIDELASPEAAFFAGAAVGAFGSPLSGGAGVGAVAGAGIEFGGPPLAFASGEAGFGLDLGASASAGASLGGGLSTGASLGSGAGASFGLEDIVSVEAGGLELNAFAGLNAPSVNLSASASLGGGIDFELPDAPGLGAGASLGAGISLGGAAGISAGASVGGGQVASIGKEYNLADILFREDE